jgi:hypothetical protein
MNIVTPPSKSKSKSKSTYVSKDIDSDCDKNKYNINDEKILAKILERERKKKVFHIFNDIKDDNCCDKKGCDNLQNIFEYLQNECYDAFNIDPHDQGPGSCKRIKEKREQVLERYNKYSKTGGKKNKTKKNKTKKHKK